MGYAHVLAHACGKNSVVHLDTVMQCCYLTKPMYVPYAGDLDGDIFFVCWDPDLIPHKTQICQPLSYSGATERPQGPVGRVEMIEYFAYHSQSILGRLNRCFEHWANLKGVRCKQCVQLAMLFSLGVDSVKSGKHCDFDHKQSVVSADGNCHWHA